jgi:hypothetical protein
MMLNQSRLCHLTTLVVIASFVVVLCAPRAAARRVEPLRLNADQPQLFIDDYLIAETKGLKRTLHQPEDVPSNPVILPEHPWEHRRIPYGSVWYDARQELYVGAAKSSLNRKRAQFYAWSPDAINWTRTTDWIHTADERDHPGDEAEAAYGFRYGDQYVGFCEMRRVRKGEAVKINWELMTSRDGRDWKRPIRELFFADGPEQSWRHQVFKIFANPPIERDGKLWIYYGGKTGTVSLEEGTEPFQALCVATMRKDGFVSLEPDESGGHVVTKPLVAVGKQLHLNVAVRAGGHAKVALLDESGTPLPGFGLTDSKPIRSEGLDQLVSWSSGSDISKLAGQSFRVRIDLSDARLYAMEFRKVPGAR